MPERQSVKRTFECIRSKHCPQIRRQLDAARRVAVSERYYSGCLSMPESRVRPVCVILRLTAARTRKHFVIVWMVDKGRARGEVE